MTTTIAKGTKKRRGFVGRWIARMLGMDDEVLTEKIIAVLNASLWSNTTACISCGSAIALTVPYCDWCGVKQDAPSKPGREDTQPLFAIQVGHRQLVFNEGETGKLQLDGMRPMQAYHKVWEQTKQHPDAWLNDVPTQVNHRRQRHA